MSKNLTINGAAYNGISNVTIGSAIFRDADEVITIPTATKTITENGTDIDILNYSKATVNVPVGVQPSGTLVLNLSESIADRDCANYAKVTVNITKDASAPVLSSISATYSGGTVEAGTTLTQLTGISITATYTMTGYTGTITKSGITTGYTLSGNLTAGQTNTITVSYGGKTSAIQVPVAAEPLVLDKLVVTYDNSTPVEAGTALSALNEVVKAQYTNGTQTGALTENTDYELSGTLTAGQTNTITVTGKGTYAGLAAVTFSVMVKTAVISVTGVSVSPNTKTITAGETFTITATITPSNATNKNVTWMSTAPSIASVTGNGLTATVNALTAGSASIKAVTADGSYEAICAVTVEAAAASKHSITYDSTVDGAQTVVFSPMPTEVDEGTSTSISMTPASLTADYYTNALSGVDTNEVKLSSAKVGNTKISGTNSVTIPNQASDAEVSAVPTVLFRSTNQAYTAGTSYAPQYSGYVAGGCTMLYELKQGKKYVYTPPSGIGTATFRVIFFKADKTAMGSTAERYLSAGAVTIPYLGGTVLGATKDGSVVTVPTDAKYFIIRHSSGVKDAGSSAGVSMLLEAE